MKTKNFVPRGQSRAPLMRRLRNAMNAALSDLISVQTTGRVFQPSASHAELAYVVAHLVLEHELVIMDPNQRALIEFAEQLDFFIAKLKGVRLRPMNREELAEVEKREMQPVRNREMPALLRRNLTRNRAHEVEESSGANTSLTGFDDAGFPEFKEVKEEHCLIKEENLCEVDTTPLMLEPISIPIPHRTTPETGPSAMISEIKEEIKEEELDDFFDIPAAPQSPLLLESACKTEPLDIAPIPSTSECALSQLAVAVRRAKRPCHHLDIREPQTSAAKWRFKPASKIASQALMDDAPSNKQCAPAGTDHLSGQIYRMSAVISTSHQLQSAAKHTISFNSKVRSKYRLVECETCKRSVEMKELARHFQTYHSERSTIELPALPTHPVVRCEERACDFVCETFEEILGHTEALHGPRYDEWQTKGRLRLLPGTYCPYCNQVVYDLAHLKGHLHKKHPHKKDSKPLTCSTCSTRFGKLFEVYDHWIQQITCTGLVRITQNLQFRPPSPITERSYDLIARAKSTVLAKRPSQ